MDEGQLQLNYLTKVMALCHPFEERFVCHSPYVEANSSIETDEAEDEDGFEVTVKLKPGDGYPVIVFQKEEVLIGELHMYAQGLSAMRYSLFLTSQSLHERSYVGRL